MLLPFKIIHHQKVNTRFTFFIITVKQLPTMVGLVGIIVTCIY